MLDRKLYGALVRSSDAVALSTLYQTKEEPYKKPALRPSDMADGVGSRQVDSPNDDGEAEQQEGSVDHATEGRKTGVSSVEQLQSSHIGCWLADEREVASLIAVEVDLV